LDRCIFRIWKETAMTGNLSRLRRTILLLVLTSLSAGLRPATSQDTAAPKMAAPDTAVKATAFEAVTIKPSDRTDKNDSWGVWKNQYSARNTPLSLIILQAYIEGRPPLDRLKGAPDWVMNDRYFITAKVDDATADSWKGLRQSQQVTLAAPLLRKMFEDRCKLVAHTVPTELQGYALVLGKRPLKLKEWKADEPLPKGNYGMLGGGSIISYSQPDDPFPSTSFMKFTIAQLIEFVGAGGPPVVDQTGLTGTYDLTLPRFWSMPPPQQEGSAAALPPAPPDVAHVLDWQSVGLEMKPIKVPGFNLVIDHIERPSAN
jgi:uncharacterized protein (TIGR03435 family)